MLTIRKIVKNKDSENGVHVKFNLKTKYEDVIGMLRYLRRNRKGSNLSFKRL